MNIAIINGNPFKTNNDFDNKLEFLSELLKKSNNKTDIFKLRDMNINKCIGCYSCWLKTPGLCIFKDDMPAILSEYVNSDLIILSSPVILNFTSALLKSMQERLLPLALPFIYVEGDRNQHVPRYEKTVKIVLLVDKANEDIIKLIENVFKSSKTRKFVFIKVINNNVEELVNEINGI